MVNKLVSNAVVWGAKKLGNKALEKASETYDNFHQKILNESFLPKPLNVGEDEGLACHRYLPNKKEGCPAWENHIRKEYQRTGKYKWMAILKNIAFYFSFYYNAKH